MSALEKVCLMAMYISFNNNIILGELVTIKVSFFSSTLLFVECTVGVPT